MSDVLCVMGGEETVAGIVTLPLHACAPERYSAQARITLHKERRRRDF